MENAHRRSNLTIWIVIQASEIDFLAFFFFFAEFAVDCKKKNYKGDDKKERGMHTQIVCGRNPISRFDRRLRGGKTGKSAERNGTPRITADERSIP